MYGGEVPATLITHKNGSNGSFLLLYCLDLAANKNFRITARQS